MIAGVNAAGGSHSFAGMPPSTRLKVVDTDVVSVGKVEAEDGDQESVSKDSRRYLRFLHRDGRLLGAVMVGDAALSAAARDAIEKGRDLSHVLGQDADADSIAEALRQEG
jgi:NAD(P)H-nitrite reductase large subunit